MKEQRLINCPRGFLTGREQRLPGWLYHIISSVGWKEMYQLPIQSSNVPQVSKSEPARTQWDQTDLLWSLACSQSIFSPTSLLTLEFCTARGLCHLQHASCSRLRAAVPATPKFIIGSNKAPALRYHRQPWVDGMFAGLQRQLLQKSGKIEPCRGQGADAVGRSAVSSAHARLGSRDPNSGTGERRSGHSSYPELSSIDLRSDRASHALPFCSSSYTAMDLETKRHPIVLTIAGSDSSGGAGIQADLKTFTTLKAYGMSVITAITSQNTMGVNGVEAVSPPMVSKQFEAVISDIPVSAIKTGMLYNAEIIKAVQASLSQLYPELSVRPHLVIDPVMVSSSGHDLLELDAINVLTSKLLGQATIITPNIPEAIILSGRRARHQTISSIEDMENCCIEISRLGAKNVLLKGGHLSTAEGMVVDILYVASDDTFHTFSHPRLQSNNTHGTGCTLSAALTVYLAKGLPLVEAVDASIKYVTGAIQTSLEIGNGSGPLNHFYNVIQRSISIPSAQQQYPFTSALIDAAGDLWKIFTSDHQFLAGVRNAKLPRRCFQHFLQQDYIFLLHYARIHSLMALKCDTMDEIDATTDLVKSIVAESKNHIKKCVEWGISKDDFLKTPESNQTIAYTRYVLDIGFTKSLLHLRVATAPCLIGYGEMALKLRNDPLTVKNRNPYWDWIVNYSGEEFQKAVKTGRDLLEQTAMKDPPSCETMHELKLIFRKAVNLEIAFWQMGLDCS
ncbi:hypothetical protein O181_019315 [Austropuccinia psidii MF-1]|uniref:Phosphomethylpyrimidine kinase n=1 Tax=Austropuccinia psidii MF-1 TaxID=1389203 RepID=A0A9Q3CAD0_9BASI|nr:hypothetical protein [Austropuccinia psidii MF-1]